MSRAARIEQKTRRVAELEQEFREVLIPALRQCTDGGRGAFLREEEAAGMHEMWMRFVWKETRTLETLGVEIVELRESLGLPQEDSLYAKFLRYCAIRGENAPGGAKLAKQFLHELGAD